MGRARKHGKRTKSGRLSRAVEVRYDKGTERAQAIQALYGQDGCDAIGRAYRAGLLGTGSEAKVLLDTARAMSHAYWQAYEQGGFRSPLADREFGTIVQIDHIKVRRREEWLHERRQCIASMGYRVRKAFDQLVIDVNPDHGPDWLDRLCWTHQQNEGRKPAEKLLFDHADMSTLRAALDGLEAIAS